MENLKFFGQTFRAALLFIFLAETLSFFVYWLKISLDLSAVFFIIAALAILIAALIDLKYGLYTALAEAFVGSQGHLLTAEFFGFNVSIRMAIFAAAMLAWLIYIFKNKLYDEVRPAILDNKSLLYLGLVCLWGIIMAFINNNSPKLIFLDFNGWLYFLYFLPFITYAKTRERLNDFLQIFIAGMSAVILKTLIFLYVFSHRLTIMNDFYKWGRDTLWGEFTLINGNLFRIFSQAHIFILIGFLIILGFLIFNDSRQYKNPHTKFLSLVLLFSLSVVIISLSRSFWVGLILAALTLSVLMFWIYKMNWKKWLYFTLRALRFAVFSYAAVLIVINFPLPKIPSAFEAGNFFAERIDLSGAGVSSRWSQLPNLIKGISAHPIIGSGWGTIATYESQDPRILTAENPRGQYTTYAFEWGYLDIVLKIGLVGLFAYLYLLLAIVKQYWLIFKKNSDRETCALVAGLMVGLLALVVVSGFSPYLNHPLGISYIVFLLTIAKLFNDSKTINPELNRQTVVAH